MHWCSLGHGSIPSIRHKRLSIGEEGGPGTRLSTNFLSFLPIISVQFFPAKRASIEFGSCLHLLWLPSPNPDNSAGVHSRSSEEPGIWFSICVFACLWISYLCICMFMNITFVFCVLVNMRFGICVCKIIIFVYLPSTTSPSKARQPCRRPLHVQGRTGCIKSILGSKGATKPMAWVAFSTRFISKGLGGQVFRRLEHKRGDLLLL